MGENSGIMKAAREARCTSLRILQPQKALWAAMTPPNVLVPYPGYDNDILVYFFGASGLRTTTDHIEVMNDWDANPFDIYLEGFDAGGYSLGRTLISDRGEWGEVNATGISYAMIYGAPGSGGDLGVDSFRFNASPDHPSTGGCCLPSDYCANLTASLCTKLGGTYAGDGVVCPLDRCSLFASVESPATPQERGTLGALKYRYH
jgi:hypothetical protein